MCHPHGHTELSFKHTSNTQCGQTARSGRSGLHTCTSWAGARKQRRDRAIVSTVISDQGQTGHALSALGARTRCARGTMTTRPMRHRQQACTVRRVDVRADTDAPSLRRWSMADMSRGGRVCAEPEHSVPPGWRFGCTVGALARVWTPRGFLTGSPRHKHMVRRPGVCDGNTRVRR